MMLDDALDYASRGLPVFPVYPVIPFRERFVCKCFHTVRCENPGKHPMTTHGLKDATIDPEVIRHRWACAPDANLGIATSRAHVVLDVDPGHGGDGTLNQLERRHGALPKTWTVKTGGDGRHFYFSANVDIHNSTSKVGQGLDIRGIGGYVVAPPSLHVSGNRYAWEPDHGPGDIPLAAMPAWLTAAALGPVSTAGRKVAMPASCWRELVRNGVGEGARNDAIARITGHLLRRYIDPEVTLELVQVWNAVRCRPPLDDREVEAIVDRIAGCELKRRGAAHG